MTEATFDYQLTEAADFESLLANSGTPIDDAPALAMIRSKGRSLLQARGGAGKTSYLAKINELALAEGYASVIVPSLTWARAFESESGRLDHAQSLERLIEIEAGESIGDLLVILDGVNEVTTEVTNRLIAAVDIAASREPRYSFVLADRLNRRELNSDNWALLGLTSVSESSIREHVATKLSESELRSLSSPFYLDRAASDSTGSRGSQHEHFLMKHAGVRPEEFDALAEFAFGEYERHSAREINPARGLEQLGNDLFNRLVAAGVIVIASPSYFSHHLIADFLAALHLSSSPEPLTYHQLNTLTFRASSFDALALLLELSRRSPDDVVRDVYDWNMYAAGYLLAEDRASARRVSKEMESVIVGMLGDRMFDTFGSTAGQVSDALRVIDSSLSRSVLAAESRAEVVTSIQQGGKSLFSLDWYRAWMHRFSISEDSGVDADARRELTGADPIIGWTASNSLRRASITPADTNWAISLLRSRPESQVRWRAAHLLGAVNSEDAVMSLLDALDSDSEEWVRYGALRSLVEIAAGSDGQLSELVIASLSERSDVLSSKPRLARELEKTLPTVASAGGQWMDRSESLVVALWAHADTVDEQDRWSGVGRNIREQSLA